MEQNQEYGRLMNRLRKHTIFLLYFLFSLLILLPKESWAEWNEHYTMIDVFNSNMSIVSYLAGFLLAFWPLWLFLIGLSALWALLHILD